MIVLISKEVFVGLGSCRCESARVVLSFSNELKHSCDSDRGEIRLAAHHWLAAVRHPLYTYHVS